MTTFTGIDVARRWLDVYSEQGHFRVANDPGGYEEIAARTRGPYAVEATSTYHVPVARHLWRLGSPVYLVSPLQVRRFAQASMLRNKTDKIDAEAIARYAEVMHEQLSPWEPLNEDLAGIRVMVSYARGLMRHRIANSNRLHALLFAYPEHAPELEAGLNVIEDAIKRFYKRALAIAYENPTLGSWIDAWTEMPGVGERVAITILAYTGDIRRFKNARAYAAYTGLTPVRKQSGESEGKAHISRLGPGPLREALFIAARSAVRWDPYLRGWYERKVREGKPKILVLTAVARKIAEKVYNAAAG